MWDDLVRDRRGSPLASLAEAGDAKLAGARFVAVLCHDDGILPAVAAVEPAQAVAHLTLGDAGPVAARAAAANRFLERLPASGVDAYLLKSGRVGGADPERSIEITGITRRRSSTRSPPARSSGSRIPTSATGWPRRSPASRAATVSSSSLASCMRAPSVCTSTRPWFPS